jgi:hypothetical protein
LTAKITIFTVNLTYTIDAVKRQVHNTEHNSLQHRLAYRTVLGLEATVIAAFASNGL